jgi:hypothetical protein
MTLQTVREAVPDRTGTPHLADMVDNPGRKPTRFGFRRSVVANWSDLRPGDTVVLVGSSNERVSGTVDAVTTEGDMMWILLDNGAGRKLFHNSDTYQTLTDPKAF